MLFVWGTAKVVALEGSGLCSDRIARTVGLGCHLRFVHPTDQDPSPSAMARPKGDDNIVLPVAGADLRAGGKP